MLRVFVTEACSGWIGVISAVAYAVLEDGNVEEGGCGSRVGGGCAGWFG